MLRSTTQLKTARVLHVGIRRMRPRSNIPSLSRCSDYCRQRRLLSSSTSSSSPSSSTRKKSTIVPTEDMLSSPTTSKLSSVTNEARRTKKKVDAESSIDITDDKVINSTDSIDSYTTKVRRQFIFERFLNFPKGFKQMYFHALRYKSIHDASRTPLNAWTIDHPVLNKNRNKKTQHNNNINKEQQGWEYDSTSFTSDVSHDEEAAAESLASNDETSQMDTAAIPLSTRIKNMKNRFGFLIYGNERRPGRIPRRQHEQQRQTLEDYKQMGILIALYMPPIIGELPVILAALFPRQVLSRQFHNPYEWEAYAQMEHAQRKSAFIELGDQFWSTILPPAPRTLSLLFQTMSHTSAEVEDREDAAGPMIDAIRLYAPFAAGLDHHHNIHQTHVGEEEPTSRGRITPPTIALSGSIYRLPREYLVKLSLASGIFQSLPKWLSPWVTEWTPTWCLAYQIDRIGRIIVQDDSLLLEEGYDITECRNMTDTEVLDACLIRGLPVMNHSAEERRRCLTNHLKLIGSVKQRLLLRQQQQQQYRIGDANDRNIFKSDGFRLFTLHLNPLRYHLKKTHSQGTAK